MRVEKASVIAAAKTLMDERFAKYRTEQTSSFGGVKDGKVKHKIPYTYMDGMTDYHHGACIAAIPQFADQDCLYHFAKYRGVEYGEAANYETYKRFVAWFCGPESPWRDIWNWKGCPDKIEVDGENCMSIEFNQKYGFIVPSLELPGNLIGSFLTAARSCHEWAIVMKSWDKMVAAGFNPSAAYLLAGYFNNDNGHVVIADSGHWAFELTSLSLEAARNFVACKPVKAHKEPFSKKRQYTSVNRLFGERNPNENYGDDRSVIYKSILDNAEKISKKTSWGDTMHHHVVKDVVETCREAHDRIMEKAA